MNPAEAGNNTLVARLTQIRQRLQRHPFLPADDSPPEHWVDTAPLAELDGEQFVVAAYLQVLRRKPDAAGIRSHTAQLLSGQMTKPELLVALAQSPEGQQHGVRFVGLRALPVQQSFRDPSIGTSEAFVRALGRYYNGVEPAEDSLARWVALLEQGKLSREAVIRIFATSAQLQRTRPFSAVLDEVHALSSTVTDMRQELQWHQRVLESLLSQVR